MRLLFTVSQLMQWSKKLMHMLICYFFQICVLNRSMKCFYVPKCITNGRDFRQQGRLKRQNFLKSLHIDISSVCTEDRLWCSQRIFRLEILWQVFCYMHFQRVIKGIVNDVGISSIISDGTQSLGTNVFWRFFSNYWWNDSDINNTKP